MRRIVSEVFDGCALVWSVSSVWSVCENGWRCCLINRDRKMPTDYIRNGVLYVTEKWVFTILESEGIPLTEDVSSSIYQQKQDVLLRLAAFRYLYGSWLTGSLWTLSGAAGASSDLTLLSLLSVICVSRAPAPDPAPPRKIKSSNWWTSLTFRRLSNFCSFVDEYWKVSIASW